MLKLGSELPLTVSIDPTVTEVSRVLIFNHVTEETAPQGHL